MMRSVTAENMFRVDPMLEVKSAGTHPDAVVRVNDNLLKWADLIFVMEDNHEVFIDKNFTSINNQKIICLNISDEYNYMDDDLMTILRKQVRTHLDDYINSEQTNDSDSRC
jgi:predicted protein tyrosine phosphatase